MKKKSSIKKEISSGGKSTVMFSFQLPIIDEYSDLRSSMPMLMDWIGVIKLCAMLSGIVRNIVKIIIMIV